jgi:hypothetical protein
MRSKRIANYARVSTKHKDQDVETQLRALPSFANNRGFNIRLAGPFIGVTRYQTESMAWLIETKSEEESRSFNNESHVTFRFCS